MERAAGCAAADLRAVSVSTACKLFVGYGQTADRAIDLGAGRWLQAATESEKERQAKTEDRLISQARAGGRVTLLFILCSLPVRVRCVRASLRAECGPKYLLRCNRTLRLHRNP